MMSVHLFNRHEIALFHTDAILVFNSLARYNEFRMRNKRTGQPTITTTTKEKQKKIASTETRTSELRKL